MKKSFSYTPLIQALPTFSLEGRRDACCKAFTLIELLVVVLIIGILAAVALPQYQKAVWKSRYMQLMITVDAIARAEEVYYLANNSYTDDLEALDIQVQGQSGNTVDTTTYACTMDTTYQEVRCEFKNLSPKKFGYHIYLSRAKNNTGKKFCFTTVGDSTSVYAQICKGLTGKEGEDSIAGSGRRSFLF